MNGKRNVCLAIALGAPLALFGPGSAPSPPPVHEDVVVTADRAPELRDAAPAAVSTLTREEIDALPARDLGELLRYLPGFELYFGADAGGTPPMLTARGFFGGGDAEYVQVRIDGVPVGDANSGIVDWRALPAGRIERIEALRGAASPLYGDTALAGVIQVFTRVPEGATASASGGSFGSASASAAARASAGDGGVSIAANASRTDGFRAHAAENDEGFAAGASRGGDIGEWSLTVAGTSKDRDDPGQLPLDAARSDPRSSDPLFRFDREKTDRLRGAIAFERSEGPAPFRASVYGTLRRTDLVRTLLVAPALGERAAQALDSNGMGAIVDGRWTAPESLGGIRMRGGAEWSRDSVDSVYRSVADDGAADGRIGAARGARDRFGAFAAADGEPFARLRLSAGLRWDRVSDRLTEPRVSAAHEAWSPQLGAVFFLGRNGAAAPSLFARWSRAFKAATFDQQFDPRPFSDFQGGTFTVSNPELSPQRARMIEGGVRVPGARGRVDATAYRIDVDDEIDFDPAIFRYRNIGRSRHTGLETSAQWRWSADLSTFASWDWARVEARGEGGGGQLKNIPEHVVRAGAAARLPGEIEAEAVWTWTGRRWLDDADRFRLSDASVVDLRVSRRFGDVRIRLDVANLADARYADVGFTLSDFEGRDVPHVYPASGRSFRIGIDWRR